MRIALKHIGQKHKEKPQSMGSTIKYFLPSYCSEVFCSY